MKTSNLSQGPAHREALIRGWVSPYRAGSSGVSVSSGGTSTTGIVGIDVVGGTVTDNGDGTITITISTGDFELNIEGGQDVISDHGAMGATETFDPTDGNVHTGILDANCTFTLNAPAGSGAATLELWITGDGTNTWTWPGSVTWDGGVTGDPPGDAETVRVILETIDGGTNWIANMVGGGGAGASALDDLSDVTLTSPATADRLRYDGSVWRNSALIWRPVTTYDATSGLWVPVVDGDGNAVMAEA